jgi:rRNA-processing protein FCF1
VKTVLENVRGQSARLRQLLEELSEYSSIKRWYNPNNDGFIWIGGHFAWEELSDDGRQAQAKTLEDYRRFYSILKVLLREQPEDTLGKVDEANTRILQLIQQREPLYTDDTKAQFQRAFEALDSQTAMLGRLYGQSDGRSALVPDTNALIFNPAVEKWLFDEFPEFSIVLTPPVLSELDSLKVNHRVEAVREKSEQVIRRIKEFRRRAVQAGVRLADGVVLVEGVSDVVAIATEPQMEMSLPWLDPANADDRLLAVVIEVMRTHPRTAVVLVTRDINLQNKAEFANVPFVEPPDQE